MARHPGPRTVQCYHCRHRFDVGGRAQSTSCPHCHKALIVADVIVDKLRGPLREIRTCGRVEVHKRGRLIAELIEAHGGIECQGIIESHRVISGAAVTLGPKAQFKGDLQAPSLQIQLGARLYGWVQIPDDSLGLSDLPRTA